jgi:peptidyl-dipeptidase A
MSLAYWNAAITGSSEEYERYSLLQIELKKIYSDTEDFEFLSGIREADKIKDPLLLRQSALLYNAYLENQLDGTLLKDLVEGSTAIEERFNTFRAVIDGSNVTNNEILEILKEETDSAKRRKAWEGSKQIGQVVADDIRKLARKRNVAAQSLGFSNFFQMQLALSEQNEEDLFRIFDELDSLTAGSFFEVKATIDSSLADRYSIEPADMMPWHYHDPFFQEAPSYLEIDLDSFFANKDIVEIATRYFEGIGLEVDAIFSRSDLYEKDGKNQHAFCTDIDREGDVRILVNIKDNTSWTETTLHELGHAVYDQYIDHTLPFILRGAAHSLTTEGVAMLMGRQVKNPDWLKDMMGITEEEKEQIQGPVRELLTAFELTFSRWCQVMVRFEKALYTDPEQDLNSLWWTLVEKYQGLTKPEGRDAPDWAAKIHIAAYPVYYHNYMLGELFASQIQAAIGKGILNAPAGTDISFAGHPEAGKYLIEKVFSPGASLRWDELVKQATGEPLSAKHFASQFVR